ncbi:MAG: gliding motility-associated C-terminal domain-containing protein [Bacteroidia bacterium]
MKKILSVSGILFLLVVCPLKIKAQLKADAGIDKVVCPDSTALLGGAVSATGGVPPYTYYWSPSTGLNNSTIANPIVKPTGVSTYTLEITDATGATSKDSVLISFNYINEINAGPNVGICDAGTAVLGDISNTNTGGATYSWLPTTGLSDATSPRPTVNVTVTTTYTLTATVPGCPAKTDVVSVIIIPTPIITAGTDVIIKQGESTQLTASGGDRYEWSPFMYLSSYMTATPIATPAVTTIYTVTGSDATGKCFATASVTVIVKPILDIVISNTFTPNNDLHNDKWVIANIENFPNNSLEIYNRYGKLVYKTTNYLNTWEGNSFGNALPAATYFYILSLGDGSAPRHGTVTIIY